MSIVIVDNESSYTEDLIELLEAEHPKVIHYQELTQLSLSKNDTVILTGGHKDPVLWHDSVYAKEIEIIKKHTGPVIGICLGFELIAHVFGSHLHLLSGRRKGVITLIPTGKGPLSIPVAVRVYENHNWSVRTLKSPLIALATSKDGIEILKHRRKPIYGMQFHPEKSSEAGKKLLQDILTIVNR
jgi:GMP synthase (glutamine-hydrolysing)